MHRGRNSCGEFGEKTVCYFNRLYAKQTKRIFLVYSIHISNSQECLLSFRISICCNNYWKLVTEVWLYLSLASLCYCTLKSAKPIHKTRLWCFTTMSIVSTYTMNDFLYSTIKKSLLLLFPLSLLLLASEWNKKCSVANVQMWWHYETN